MSGAYTFGDSDLARERLALVADTFESPTRALLRDIPPGARRYVLDLGCGPGYTTRLLYETFRGYVTGLDASSTMIVEAAARVPEAQFVAADVTQPLRLPAHLVFARLLLGHLAEPASALAHWANALLPGGALVCEEPVQYRSNVEAFVRYEEAVTATVAASGATLWAGPALDSDPPRCVRALDRVVQHPVPATRAAAMFWRNGVSWGADPGLVEELRAIEAAGSTAPVVWDLRQVCWTRQTS